MAEADDLVKFLRARLDEDEQAARQASVTASAEWHLDEEYGETILWWPPEPRVAAAERRLGLHVTSDRWRGQTIESNGPDIAPHIARHDPKRVLAEVAAKRRMIDTFTLRYEASKPGKAEAAHWVMLTDMLRLLALPYADHPDYRAEWAPPDA